MDHQDRNDRDRRARDIFLRAVEIQSAEARAAYMEGACQHDSSLRLRVEALLASHLQDSFLETSAVSGPPSATFTPPLSEASGTVIGRYTLLQRIGEGGFGAVYMAEQKEPVRRRVALKIIKLGMDTQQVVARFEAERQALAMMDHPNIAKILDAGLTECLVTSALCFDAPDESERADESEPIGKIKSQIANRKSQITAGRPYFVMELVKGQTVTKYCDEHQLSTRQRLELFIPICQAIQHAHQKGIIHRDVKPSNILIATIDGRPVPKVIDFGIAKATQHDLTDKIVFTQFTQFMGTPAYMSPEQAAQDSTDIDTRSDIYSLGVLLYELLTGKTPVEANELSRGGYDEIRRRIREIDPPRPSERLTTLTNEELTTVARSRAIEPAKLTKLIRGELDWIVLKAMEKDRSRRYETASALAQDIQRYLEGEPVTAVKPSPIYRFQKFARRHKTALAAAACFALLLTVSACVSTAQAIKNKSLFTAAEEARLAALGAKERETELRRIAETERGKAEAERARGRGWLYTAHMNLAKQAWDDANVSRAMELLKMHRPRSGQPDLRSFEWHFLNRITHPEFMTIPSTNVDHLIFSGDGKHLAASSHDQTGPVIKLWDALSGRETLTLRGRSGQSNRITSLAFSPDGNRLATASMQSVKIWDTQSGEEMLTFKGPAYFFTSVAFSPDGRRLASSSSNHAVKIWDATTGLELLAINGNTNPVQTISFTGDGKILACVVNSPARSARPPKMKIWDSTTGHELHSWNFEGPLESVALSADGKKLGVGGWDRSGTIKILNSEDGHELLRLKGHTDSVLDLAFSADGTRLASASVDRTVKVWDIDLGEEIFTFKLNARENFDQWDIKLAFSSDGRRVARAVSNGSIKVWDATKSQESVTLLDTFGKEDKGGWEGGGLFTALSTDGKWLAWSTNREVILRDVSNGQDTLRLQGHTRRVVRLRFSPDGKKLVSATSGQNVPRRPAIPPELKVWDTGNGNQMFELKGHTNLVSEVAFSPDGRTIASASFDKTVKLWDSTTGQELLTFTGHTDRVGSVAFSPDGNSIASASYDNGVVKVWDPRSGREIMTWRPSEGQKYGALKLTFSADGKQMASSSLDQVTIWDASNGQELLTLKGHRGWVNSLAFSPDGRRLVSGSDDRTVKLWDTITGQETLTLNHKASVYSVAFIMDGNQLVSAGENTVLLWDARPRPETLETLIGSQAR